MRWGDIASPSLVLRSQRPQTRLETSCTRTGRPRRLPAVKPGNRTAGEGPGRTARMHVPEESDSGAVPMNHSNKDEKLSAESEEERPLIKENILQPSTHSTRSEARVSQGLAGVRKAARESKELKFTALLHHMSVDLLRESFRSLKRKAAPGVDGMTWLEYETGLEGRITDLHSRVHRGAYRALPSRRVYIEKEDGRKRPLGIAALEDKIVQQAVVTILNQIYEEDFLGFSYGFRPGRSQHQALDALSYALLSKKVNYVLDADLQSFFDTLDKSWLIKFVEHRVADPENPAADPEMAQRWGDGGRRVVGNADRYPARLGDFTAACQYLSALFVRPLGGGLAQEMCARRGGGSPLCGRHHLRIPASGRRGAFPGEFPGTTAEVWVGTPSR